MEEHVYPAEPVFERQLAAATDRWSELPLAPVPTRSGAVLAWTGSELLYWGGNGDEGPEMDGAAWRPSGP